MITINLDEYLEKKLTAFARENNLQIEELIETVLFEYIDQIEEENGPIDITDPAEKEYDNYNDGDIEYLERALGFKKKED